MELIMAGSDVSGSPRHGEQIFVSFVVGIKQEFYALHRKTGVKKIHMARLKSAERAKVIDALDFSSEGCLAFCFHVRRQEVVNGLYGQISKRGRGPTKAHIYVEFDKAFLRCFREKIQAFCAKNGVEIEGLGAECDSDMEKTVKRWGMVSKNEGVAHGIADAVSWCNTHNVALRGCREVDLAEHIRKRLRFSMRR